MQTTFSLKRAPSLRGTDQSAIYNALILLDCCDCSFLAMTIKIYETNLTPQLPPSQDH